MPKAKPKRLRWYDRPKTQPIHGYRLLRSSERMIQAHDPRVLATYYYLKLRCRNSIVYGDIGTAKRLKVSTTTVKTWLRKLAKAALLHAEGDRYRLVPILAEGAKHAKRGRLRHQCTLKIRSGASVRDIQDILHLKIFEQRHRQVAKAIAKAKELDTCTSETKRNKIIRRWRPRQEESVLSPFRRRNDALTRSRPLHVPMSIPAMAKALDLSIASTRRWKKRMTAKGLVSQVDRRIPVSEPTSALLENKDLVEAAWRCRIYGNRWIYAAQSSTYKPLINYQRK